MVYASDRAAGYIWCYSSRLDYGKKYCHSSPTLDEVQLQKAVARAIERYDNDDRDAFMILMKATIRDAIGLTDNTDESKLLKRRVDVLNKKMMDIVNESLAKRGSIDDRDDEFKKITDEIDSLTKRI